MSPYPEMAETIRTLARHDALRPRLVGAALARAISKSPEVAGAADGGIEQAELDTNGRLFLKGWARIPGEHRAADCVVIGYETPGSAWKPFCVIETSRNAQAGFSRWIVVGAIPSEAVTFRAWAVDLISERAFPMAGAAPLARPG